MFHVERQQSLERRADGRELYHVTFAPDGLTLAYSSLRGDIGLLDLDT
jgi:hypothetical protein